MSQAGQFLFGGSGTQIGSVVVTDDGTATANVSGVLNAVGGSNMNTAGAGNTVTINLDNIITINSADIGNVDIATNTITTGNTDGNLIFDPDGTGRVEAFYLNNNAAVYFDSNRDMQSATLTNGQLLVGSTGSSPAAANITAGNNITVDNAPGSITISRSDTGPGGVLRWVYLDWQVLGQNFTQLMEANTGYIVDWRQGSPYTDTQLEFQFPTSSNRAIGDVYSISIFRGSGLSSGGGLNGSGYSIGWTTRTNEAIQAPFQKDLYITKTVYAAEAADPISGTRLEIGNITFVCTQVEVTNPGTVNNTPATFQVIAAQNSFVYLS